MHYKSASRNSSYVAAYVFIQLICTSKLKSIIQLQVGVIGGYLPFVEYEYQLRKSLNSFAQDITSQILVLRHMAQSPAEVKRWAWSCS